MNQVATSYQFARMKRKYQWTRGTEILLWSVGIGVVTFYLCQSISISTSVGIGVSLTFISIAVFVGSSRVHLFGISENDLAMYLNRNYPALQESADLLIKNDADLTRLQLLQKARAAQQFDAIYQTIKLPHQMGRAIVVFGLSVLLSAGLTAFLNPSEPLEEGATSTAKIMEVEQANLPIKIRSTIINIFPPVYTQIKNHSSKDYNLKIPEGTKVVWDITFEDDVLEPLIIFSGRDSTRIENVGKGYQLEKAFSSSGFYQLKWDERDGSAHYSSYYEIAVIKDQSPSLAIENLDQFVMLNEKDNLEINLKTTLTDDYGLSRAQIIATVSKGSGEAIKFREEKLSFDSPQKIAGKKIQAIRLLDLAKLGLQPGDELYFYIEAEDNKQPIPNYARTETYFIELQDTSSIVTSIEAGLGVDLMPEYFRSQRQIIIDSEKLLGKKRKITKQTFNAASNELAHDQKVLRLRYGEFLGEEFQSSVGPQTSITNEQAQDVEKTFGHGHDTENEHNQVEEKNNAKNPSHQHEESGSGKKASPLDDFVHAHDGQDEATFFVQSIKAKLKAAVTVMWDAELYLRLYQPEKSLPYQYQALKLLKEISQDSRIYVHRAGFDPPPLKEEKRLTADLKEISNSTSEEVVHNAEQYPNIRAALTTIEKLLQQDSVELSQSQKVALTRAGQELGEIELKKPGGNLKTLSLLNSLIHDEENSKDKKNRFLKLREAFWRILPQETITPQSKAATTNDLDLQFLKHLEVANP